MNTQRNTPHNIISPNIGVGLRSEHYEFVEKELPMSITWFEALTENYLDTFGKPYQVLKNIRKHYPIALHGVGLSIASAQELNNDYLIKVKNLADEIDAFHISDHLCWTSNSKVNFHNLIPFSYNDEYLSFITPRLSYLQDYFKRPFILENLSAYFSLTDSKYTEWEFFNKLFKDTGSKMLLDVNNVYVNSKNQNFDPKEFIDAIPASAIAEIHLAGYTDMGKYLFDTHSNPVYPEVWELFKYTLAKKNISQVPILIEWDHDIPEFSVLEEEVSKAKKIWQEVYSG